MTSPFSCTWIEDAYSNLIHYGAEAAGTSPHSSSRKSSSTRSGRPAQRSEGRLTWIVADYGEVDGKLSDG
ncbi:MAG: hypothetical protein R2723_11425 [Microbacterium sp.]